MKNSGLFFILILIGSLFFKTSFLRAQTEARSLSIGIRAGDPTGITGKYFIDNNHALEGIISLWPHGPALTGLYEIHAQAFSVKGLHWYYGAGGHVRLYRDSWHRKNLHWYYPKGRYAGGVGIGVDAILGMSYKIAPIPISLSIDFKPTVEIATQRSVYFDLESAISFRYHF
jgi:hypothetical protein